MPNTAIYTRSPRIVDITGTAGDAARLDIYLWNDPDSIPSTPTYQLSKDIVSTVAYFDISPYCREYIAHQSFTDTGTGQTAATVTEYCYCTTKEYLNGSLVGGGTSEFTCFDGYGYHADGYNDLVPAVMLAEGEYYVREDVNSGALYIYSDGNTWDVTWTGLTTGGTTTLTTVNNTFVYVPLLHTNYASEGNTLLIERVGGGATFTYTITTECEPKYTPVDVDFVNKYGVWQRIVFFKASKDNIDIRSDEYKMYPSSVNYNTSDNIQQRFNTNATQKTTLNTGWVREGYSEVIQQLMLSEKVLLDGVPVNVDTKSVELFKHINEKNINYQVDFLHSYDLINYVI